MKLLLVLMVVLLAGCATTHLEQTADGVCTFEYKTLFKTPKALTIEACGAKAGFTGDGQVHILPPTLREVK